MDDKELKNILPDTRNPRMEMEKTRNIKRMEA